MTTQSLFHESLSDAIRDCINACGGPKQVSPVLWPEKTPDAAHRLLLSCLNEDRPERLTPEQLVLVFKLSRAKGCHVGITYILRELGYADAVPVEPTDAAADLKRQYIEATQSLLRMAERIEKYDAMGARMRVAA